VTGRRSRTARIVVPFARKAGPRPGMTEPATASPANDDDVELQPWRRCDIRRTRQHQRPGRNQANGILMQNRELRAEGEHHVQSQTRGRGVRRVRCTGTRRYVAHRRLDGRVLDIAAAKPMTVAIRAEFAAQGRPGRQRGERPAGEGRCLPGQTRRGGHPGELQHDRTQRRRPARHRARRGTRAASRARSAPSRTPPPRQKSETSHERSTNDRIGIYRSLLTSVTFPTLVLRARSG
jgi:hypothetical protein